MEEVRLVTESEGVWSVIINLLTASFRIYICDLPSKYDDLKEKYKGQNHSISTFIASII